MELIDKQALMDAIGIAVECKDCKRAGTFGCNESSAFAYACEMITETPPVDSAEVVRCKDCVHYKKHDRRCTVWNHGVKQADFCSCGERREE